MVMLNSSWFSPSAMEGVYTGYPVGDETFFSFAYRREVRSVSRSDDTC